MRNKFGLSWDGLALCDDIEGQQWRHMRGHCVGDRIELGELQARWAYSELTSSRFAGWYEGFPGHAALLEKAKAGIDFTRLSAGEVAQLVAMNEGGRGRLVNLLKAHTRYRCDAWTKAQLGQVMTLRMFDPPAPSVTFSAYAATPASPNHGDARRVAEAMGPGQCIAAKDPVPVVPRDNGYCLVDGYLRSLLFMRSSAPSGHILVWLPET
jgi:hypothetical protein